MTRSGNEDGRPIRAAVLVPLRFREGRASLLLTERAANLSMHAAQVAFPGGRHDVARDASLSATALREAFEEIGLAESHVELLGTLPERRTWSSNHVVTPFVGRVPVSVPLRLDEREVREAFDAPLQAFLPGSTRDRFIWKHQGTCYEVPFVAVEGHRVWGLTLDIIDDLVARLDSFLTS